MCNSAHEQTPLSNDTIDSVLRHREVSRAKDLSAPPRSVRGQAATSHGTALVLLSLRKQCSRIRRAFRLAQPGIST